MDALTIGITLCACFVLSCENHQGIQIRRGKTREILKGGRRAIRCRYQCGRIVQFSKARGDGIDKSVLYSKL
jgi:hypothetical protein